MWQAHTIVHTLKLELKHVEMGATFWPQLQSDCNTLDKQACNVGGAHVAILL